LALDVHRLDPLAHINVYLGAGLLVHAAHEEFAHAGEGEAFVEAGLAVAYDYELRAYYLRAAYAGGVGRGGRDRG
jgi:hypothetical protein